MSKQFKSPLERTEEAIRGLGGDLDEQATDEEQTQTDESQQEEVEQEEEEVAEAPSQAETEDKEEPQQQEDENSQTYKQRWEAIKGLFNGEKRKVEQLKQQLNSLQHKVEQQTQQEAPLTADATPGDIADHLSSLATEFGEDFTKALQSVVRGEISSVLDQRIKPVEDRVTQVAQDSEVTRRDKFNRDLETLAPGWNAVYEDAEFHQWLAENMDNYSGRSLSDLFDDANHSWDAQRIASFFNNYKNATGAMTSIKDDEPQQKQEDPRKKLVSPGKSNAGNPAPTGKQPKMWTIADVNKFFSDCRKGVYRGREADAARIEAEIDKANAEGRIQ